MRSESEHDLKHDHTHHYFPSGSTHLQEHSMAATANVVAVPASAPDTIPGSTFLPSHPRHQNLRPSCSLLSPLETARLSARHWRPRLSCTAATAAATTGPGTMTSQLSPSTAAAVIPPPSILTDLADSNQGPDADAPKVPAPATSTSGASPSAASSVLFLSPADASAASMLVQRTTPLDRDPQVDHPLSPGQCAVLRSQGDPSTSYGQFGRGSTSRGGQACRNNTSRNHSGGGGGAPRNPASTTRLPTRLERVRVFRKTSPYLPSSPSPGAVSAAVPGAALPLSGAQLTEAITACGSWQVRQGLR